MEIQQLISKFNSRTVHYSKLEKPKKETKAQKRERKTEEKRRRQERVDFGKEKKEIKGEILSKRKRVLILLIFHSSGFNLPYISLELVSAIQASVHKESFHEVVIDATKVVYPKPTFYDLAFACMNVCLFVPLRFFRSQQLGQLICRANYYFEARAFLIQSLCFLL